MGYLGHLRHLDRLGHLKCVAHFRHHWEDLRCLGHWKHFTHGQWGHSGLGFRVTLGSPGSVGDTWVTASGMLQGYLDHLGSLRSDVQDAIGTWCTGGRSTLGVAWDTWTSNWSVGTLRLSGDTWVTLGHGHLGVHWAMLLWVSL